MASLKQISVVLMVVMVVAAPLATEATITCSQVTKTINPCMDYLKDRAGTTPPRNCCNGVRSLKAAASTTADCQIACNCLQQAAKTISGLNLSLAASLPGKCGVSVSYKISPSTNCKTVK